MKQHPMRLAFLFGITGILLLFLSGCGSDSMSSQITLTSSRSSIPADGATTAEISATILNYDGSPARIGTSVNFTTSRGQFTSGEKSVTVGTTDTTGTVKVYLIAPLKTNPGNAQVTCTSNDITRMIVVEIDLYGPPGETAKIVLTANPTSIPADGATPSTITAALTDGNEEPVNIGTSATLTTDKGLFQNGSQRFTDVTRDTSGEIIAYLIAPKETKAGP
ncbi:MAG: Ig-like domain-containing protein, partial [Thermodesulfobacteriota bacterium]